MKGNGDTRSGVGARLGLQPDAEDSQGPTPWKRGTALDGGGASGTLSAKAPATSAAEKRAAGSPATA